jgi:hypothetical protein
MEEEEGASTRLLAWSPQCPSVPDCVETLTAPECARVLFKEGDKDALTVAVGEDDDADSTDTDTDTKPKTISTPPMRKFVSGVASPSVTHTPHDPSPEWSPTLESAPQAEAVLRAQVALFEDLGLF